MEEHSTDEQTENTSNRTSKDGTMSFIDHLDELRSRLIRFLIVMALCVLATYAFRKEILNLIKSPVDAPLKKYTQTKQLEQEKTKKSIFNLNSYNCSCQEIINPQTDTRETALDSDTSMISSIDQKSSESDPTNDQSKEETEDISQNTEDSFELGPVTDHIKSGMSVAKETINDFVMFFQILLGSEPSPIFDTPGTDEISPDPTQMAYEARPSQINLNCQCTVTSAPPQTNSTSSTMVYIGLPELFFAQMKVAIFAGFFLAFPYLLIEIWGFVGPALYRSERKVFWIFGIFSFIFFIGGALFGYFIVFPYGFDFFLSLTQLGEIMPSLSVGQYLNFALKLLLAFGFIFELPLITFILARLGIITPELMIKQARMAILIAFIISAVLTPPDPFTMILMSGPLILLYIISIGVCFVGVNRKKAALRQQGIEFDE